MGGRSATDLPFLDEHAVEIPVPLEEAWDALRAVTDGLMPPRGDLFRRLLGTDPPAGFQVVEATPPRRLTLAGRHRFSRYRLAFELSDAESGGTRLSAKSYAAFPGPHGRAYRALVVGTRLHVVATRGILRAVRAAAVSAPARPSARSARGRCPS